MLMITTFRRLGRTLSAQCKECKHRIKAWATVERVLIDALSIASFDPAFTTTVF